ncbi:MAG TPA: trypsin-like peptidase domain-containing protein [Burkholderiales bacterium]|nr:trypsin-like peptidase domain-containing protein [Burkholderiales bacterium]
MKRVAVYSTSSRSRPAAQPPTPAKPPVTFREWRKRNARRLRFGAAALAALALGLLLWAAAPEPGVSREEFEAALEKLAEQNQPAPSAADAYESILPSVVHVRGVTEVVDAEVPSTNDTQSGTGVVIVDNGTILTNLHVVAGSKQVRVVFHDGLESDAVVIGVQPEHDLAVLKARTIPDDLSAATLRSTQGLRPGEPVVAVGFPFGIGPSVSSGVISGLGREYQTADGRRALTNLIQFDAAVNPGNSGGPLITPEGEVIGIVTGLLNPTDHRVFIGIGFAVPIENAAAGVGLSPF